LVNVSTAFNGAKKFSVRIRWSRACAMAIALIHTSEIRKRQL
jgi:hypothetical protein